jgi:hypothetical protein
MSLLFFSVLVLLSVTNFAFALKSTFTSLGLDPPTVNRLNGESFQQDALISHGGYQYAAFYDSTPDANVNTTRHVSVARRKLPSSHESIFTSDPWETLTLTDYNQTLDDGHDVVSIGVSKGDGSLHLAFDQHDNNLNYRVSQKGVASNPSITKWEASIFSPVMVSEPLVNLKLLYSDNRTICLVWSRSIRPSSLM